MGVELPPEKVTSKRNISFRQSSWKVHEFEIWSGELLCRVVALRMENSLFLWLGGREPNLLEVALAMPNGTTPYASSLFGDDHGASNLAQRLCKALGRPVYVSSGQLFDRFTAPLVERGIVTEVKNNPNCF